MWFGEKKRKEALKKSSVKIKGNDVVASWKVLIGVFLVPLYVNLINLIFLIFVSQRYAKTFLGRLFATFVFCWILSLYLIFTVQLLNGFQTNLRKCIVRFWVVLYVNRIKKIREHRASLKILAKSVMDKYSEQNDQAFKYKRKSLHVGGSGRKGEIDTEEAFAALADIIIGE